jgi:peptidoglycan/xylan/chitin deacetylase (PgdA/CDA1 family)
MATGLPIITSKANTLDQTLAHPLIRSIPVTETDIRSAIKAIQRDPGLQQDMSKYAYTVATQHFSWQTNSAKLVEMYRHTPETLQNPPRVVVTTSWDDGHRLDTRLAALLKTYGIKGTFYVCPQDREWKQKELLHPEELRAIAHDFEIGGHTITHPHLTRIPLAQASDEIVQSKRYLEDVLQRDITAFCYPYGHYDSQVKRLVQQHGYTLARTTRRYAFDVPHDPFEMATSFHTYAHYSDLPMIFRFSQYSLAQMKTYWDWEYLAIALFERTCQQGGLFHLWGHSWELERTNGWQKLERVLAYIATKPHVIHQTNTQALATFQRKVSL